MLAVMAVKLRRRRRAATTSTTSTTTTTTTRKGEKFHVMSFSKTDNGKTNENNALKRRRKYNEKKTQ